jgi:hypothetical protein
MFGQNPFKLLGDMPRFALPLFKKMTRNCQWLVAGQMFPPPIKLTIIK